MLSGGFRWIPGIAIFSFASAMLVAQQGWPRVDGVGFEQGFAGVRCAVLLDRTGGSEAGFGSGDLLSYAEGSGLPGEAVNASEAEHRRFSIAQVLSAPFSNGLTAAPARARIAWFTDAEGRRNVWVAGATEAARPVTQNAADDGQDLEGLAWSGDGQRLAWTRGTGAQGPEHPVANPAELPGPVKQNVEMVDLGGDGTARATEGATAGTVHVVAEGHAPLFLRDGSALLFLRRGNIWIAELGRSAVKHAVVSPDAGSAPDSTPGSPERDGTQEPAGVRQLLFVRGAASGLRLSPDGRRLAFVSNRGDHSFVGVYDFASKVLRWMDPGVGLDHDAVWSPDGTRVAFVREVPIVSAIADRWMREGAPWSIRVAEVETGEGREIWRAETGAGSVFHGVSARDQLIWTRDGRIVFPWERGGWTRLWALDVSNSGSDKPWHARDMGDPTARGKAPVLLTEGEFEVDGVANDGVRIAWSGNAHGADVLDEDRRHVSILPMPTAVEMGWGGRRRESIDTEPVLLSDGGLAYMSGSAQRPLVPVLAERNGEVRELAPALVPKSFPAGEFVTPKQVIFRAADGMQIHGQIFVPRSYKTGEKMPAVVFFHGGSRRQMLLGFNPMQYYAQVYEFNQYLASRGFVVLSVNYRSGTGYGLNFREALNYGANGASEYNDAVGAAQYLQSRDDVDAKRIAAWGGSYGGYLTALALARSSNLYAAGVDLHGVHDWSLELDLWKPTDDPDVDEAAVAKRAFLSSPMADVKRWRSPVLLMQGDDDRNVLFSQTVRLAAALRAQGVPVEEKVFPDEVHDFLLHRNWIEAYGLAADFLERRLRAGER